MGQVECSRLRVAVTSLLLGTFAMPPLAAVQTAEDRARIDYAAAKRAVEQGEFEVALRKIEAVLAVLGDQPEIFVLAAESALALKRPDDAGKFIEKALALADDAFRSSPAFERLIDIAASVEVIRERVAVDDSKKWKKPFDSYCSIEYEPYSPTWSETTLNVSRFPGFESARDEVRRAVTSIDRNSVSFGVEVTQCDEGGLRAAGNGYSLPASLTVGVTWQYAIVFPSGNRLRLSCTASTLEPISVPAGSFQALRVDCSGQSDRDTSTSEVWYVSGIGRVKSVTTSSDGQFHSSELLRWTP